MPCVTSGKGHVPSMPGQLHPTPENGNLSRKQTSTALSTAAEGKDIGPIPKENIPQ